jgi:hypothetical protein
MGVKEKSLEGLIQGGWDYERIAALLPWEDREALGWIGFRQSSGTGGTWVKVVRSPETGT